MKLRSGNVFNELPCIPFKTELSQMIQKIKQCKVKRNRIYYINHTLNYIETNIHQLVENKKYTKKILDWLNVLERQSYHSKAIQRFEIRDILLLRKKTNVIKNLILFR